MVKVKVIYVFHPPALKKKLILEITSKAMPLAPGIAPKRKTVNTIERSLPQVERKDTPSVLELYELEIPARHATDPNWAFVQHPYNPKAPAIVSERCVMCRFKASPLDRG